MNTSYEVLERYGLDLVAQARAGRLDPVIGRDEEIRRTIRILSRKTKNNPVLIGEPGVGKTAIVELLIDELRQRLAAKHIELAVAAPARRHIAHAGFDPVYGARPLKRFLQRELETRIARLLVAGDMPEGSRVEVVLDEGQLAVRH